MQKLKKSRIKELVKIGESINTALDDLYSLIENLGDEEEESFGDALDELHGSLEESQAKVNEFLGVFQ
jgi:hypothetical protein